MSSTLDLAMDLIKRSSVTPEDAGCQKLLAERLRKAGFEIKHIRFGNVDNLWAKRGRAKPVITFAGHTDVVPPGNPGDWETPAFTPTLRDGMLYGRGAADMKGSLAAMVIATENFVAKHPDHKGSIAFLLTSDEEGPGVDGTARVLDLLTSTGERVDYCVVGEPTSVNAVGDMIKIGRRGSLSGTLKIIGVQGHVAYPERASNPIHLFAQPLVDLCGHEWDKGNEFFPPTTFQISNLHAGVGATNVIPANLEAQFNFRFSTETSVDKLKAEVSDLLESHGVKFEITWTVGGQPFLTPIAELSEATQKAIKQITDRDAEVSTTGGTSDARFFAPLGTQVVELGPVNETIHKVNECVQIDDLEKLSQIYELVLKNMLT
jgi:succinyl-diaminopimelate desuccinylase